MHEGNENWTRLGILQRAALAACDLTQPVRLTRNEGDGYVFDTCKGENVPNEITRQSADEITQFHESLLSIIDKRYAEAEDGISADTITEAEWFGPYKHHDHFYCLEDLSYQLDPNRSKTLLDPILNTFGKRSDELPLTSQRIELLRAELDKECQEAEACIYRLYFPEVGRSGPVALSPIVLKLLTEGQIVAAVNTSSLQCLLDAVLSTLVYMKEEEHGNESDMIGCDLSAFSNLPAQCICCLLTKQTRSYIDTRTEVGCQLSKENLLSWTTWIGVLKTEMVKNGHTVNETNFLSPVANIHDSKRCYLADSSPFSEYELLKLYVEDKKGSIVDSIWVVKRSSADVKKLQGIEERIEIAAQTDNI